LSLVKDYYLYLLIRASFDKKLLEVKKIITKSQQEVFCYFHQDALSNDEKSLLSSLEHSLLMASVNLGYTKNDKGPNLYFYRDNLINTNNHPKSIFF
jgi:hypothetical protein